MKYAASQPLFGVKLTGLTFLFFVSVPVSKPRLWPLSSLVDRPTCWGKSVTLRCGCAKGTGVRYAWYQHIDRKDFLLHKSSDLYLHCGAVQKDCSYFCIGSNDISSEKSELISVQVLMPANSSCIYVVNIQGKNKCDIPLCKYKCENCLYSDLLINKMLLEQM